MTDINMPEITPIERLVTEAAPCRACNEIHVCQKVPAGYTGPLSGSYQPETGFHYVWLPRGGNDRTVAVVGDAADGAGYPLQGRWEDGALCFTERMPDGDLQPLEVHRFTEELAFSRNGTLVDHQALQRRTVDVVGCGSVGYHMALTLCRAGVTRFNLVDRDRVEIHNLTRCYGRSELGSFKTHALARALLDINPDCQINTYECFLEDINDDAFYSSDGGRLLIGCADSRVADSGANRLCQIYGWDMLTVGFWSGACIDEFFVYRHGNPDDHAYGCVFRAAVEKDARIAHFANYTSSERPGQKVMPGLCASILSAISIGSQLALDLLLEGEAGYISKLLPFMGSQYMLYANCNREELAGDIASIFPRPLVSVCPSLTPVKDCTCAADHHG